MKTARIFGSRSLLGLAAAGAALLSASGASAQTTASPYYAFTVSDLTSLTGGPAYPVLDSVSFSTLQVTETFADGFTQPLALPDASAGDIVPSSLLMFSSAPNGGYSDAVHGALTSAVLTGTLAFPGITPDGTGTLSLTVQPTSDPSNTFQQAVYTPFSASLLGPATPGLAVGTFSLMNLGSAQGVTVDIDAALVPAAVPEASTDISLGLLLMLGLGGVVVARRKRTATAF